MPRQSLADTELAQLRQQLKVDLVSAALLTKWAVRRMAPAKVGRIVHVASRAATEHGAHAFAYNVAKLGVVRLVEAAAAEKLRRERHHRQLRPAVDHRRAGQPRGDGDSFTRWTKPEQIAQVIAFLVSDDAEVVSGAAVPGTGKA